MSFLSHLLTLCSLYQLWSPYQPFVVLPNFCHFLAPCYPFTFYVIFSPYKCTCCTHHKHNSYSHLIMRTLSALIYGSNPPGVFGHSAILTMGGWDRGWGFYCFTLLDKASQIGLISKTEKPLSNTFYRFFCWEIFAPKQKRRGRSEKTDRIDPTCNGMSLFQEYLTSSSVSLFLPGINSTYLFRKKYFLLANHSNALWSLLLLA